LVLDPSFLNAVNTSILPVSDNTYDLGSSSYRWRSIYVVQTFTGDLVFHNGWRVVEEGDELILVAPSGRRFRLVLSPVE